VPAKSPPHPAGTSPGTILIVGVRGLGRTIATHFAAQKWRVICAARTRDTVDAAAAAVEAAGGVGVPAVCDLQEPASLAKVVQAEAQLDLVIAAQTAGGRFGPRPILETEDSELDRLLDAYVRGSWNLLRAAGPKLVGQGRGTFLQIGTSSGVRTRDGWAPLGTAQHGLRALIQVAAKEWRPRGVHVAYLPIDGGITRETSAASDDGTSAPRALAPLEIARACLYLHEQDATAWTHELVLRPSGTDWTAPT
jgi:NAD(P)-dependent dehydrogenase (short-subunit alcohol dehydrogenase family)